MKRFRIKSAIQKSLIVTGALIVALTPFFLLPVVHAANVTVTVDGSRQFQTMDGFGVNANSASWNNGELAPALDRLVDEGGSTIFRVVVDDQDWEATNDNADPNSFNWTYYNAIYGNAKFTELWSTMAYLSQKGITADRLILCPMGKGPDWMGGFSINNSANVDSEYAEMLASMAYYARNTMGLQFTLEPNNEPDIQTEGFGMSASRYAAVMNKLALRLDAIGMNDLKLMGPSAGVIYYAVNDFMTALWDYPALMNHIDAYSFHDYNGSTGGADTAIKNSPYPTKHFYMTEYSQFVDAFAELGQGPTGMVMWDGYDSVYNHPLDRNGSTNPPNDAGDGPAMLAYNTSTGVYTPRKEFYQFKQLYAYVPAGSTRVEAIATNSGVNTYAFTHAPTGRFTLVGNNTSSSSHTLSISLANIPNVPGTLSYYQTNATSNTTQGANVAVTGGTATLTVPANTIFTLTGQGITDTQTPAAPTNLNATGGLGTAALTWNAATDNVGVTQYNVYRAATAGFTPGVSNKVGQTGTTAFTNTGLGAGTYYYKVTAQDGAGNVSAPSEETTVAVTADTMPPAVAITTPADGATVNGVTAITATASDDGAVAGVQFMLDSSPIGAEVTTSPFTLNWDTASVTNGAHTLSAVARDASGNATTSTNVAVTVTNVAGVVLLGSQTIQSNTDTNNAGAAEAFRYTATASGNAGAVKFYVAAGSAATSLKVGLYSANGTHPGTLLASGTLATPAPAAWNTIPLTTNPTLASGTTYWIGILGTGGNLSYRDATSGNCSESASSANLTALPATWTSGTSWSSCNLSAYVTSTGPADTAAPSSPGNLTQTAATPTTVTVIWDAATDNTSVDSYGYYNGSVLAGSTTETSATLTGLTCNTAYTIGADAVDAAGNRSQQTTTMATTSACDTTAPTVSLTAPNAGATVSGTSVAVTATASDDTGVAGVQFKLDGVNLGPEDTAAPYAITWNTTGVSNGTHLLTAVARDTAGNSTVSFAVQITVNNVTSTTITVDKQVTTNQTSKGTSITSPALSTTSANELLVAFVSSDGPASSAQSFSTVTGGGLSWTLRKRVNTQAGTSEIWTAAAPNTVNNITVKATRANGSYVGSITVVAFKNANIGAIGATGGANAASGAPAASLTATQTGSVVWGVGNDWDGATNRTVGAGQTLANQYLANVGDTFWVQYKTGISTASQVVTINDTAPVNHRWNLATVEILPAP